MIICFDLEGPLSPQDNAYEVMGLLPQGHEIFAKISKYDDILALKKEDYEAGYTLALILPFLISHGITEEAIKKVSSRAKINKGAKEIISTLKKKHPCYIVSTSYEQHAYSIGERVGISKDNIYCTKFPLDEYREYDIDLRDEEEKILALEESEIEAYFNEFYETLDSAIKKIIEDTTVVGGKYKTEAIHTILTRENGEMENVVAIGDSITDFKMLKAVKEGGGVSIVFNGNEYAIPHAAYAYAGRSLMPLASFIEAPDKQAFIQRWNGEGQFHLVSDDNKKIITIHKKYRNLMRGKAGELG